MSTITAAPSPKFYIGAMSTNVIKAVCEFNEDTEHPIGLIPSRRQVDVFAGYTGWSTEELSRFVRSQYSDVVLERDHGGAGQGLYDDDGVGSYVNDLQYMDIIHIDPWKKYPKFVDGVSATIGSISYLHSINPDMEFEVGTEESIKYFSASEFRVLITQLKSALSTSAFTQIKYAVVQSGVRLDLVNQKNAGSDHIDRLNEMVKICRYHGILAKEHNGDYLNKYECQRRFLAGVDAINIAPQFGQIETQVCLEEYDGDNVMFKLWYEGCLNSGWWKKWVPQGFDPTADPELLIQICGHYVLPEHGLISSDVDYKIRAALTKKLEDLHEGLET